MKTAITIVALALNLCLSAQQLTKNTETGKFEYAEIVTESRDVESFKQRLFDLGYKDLQIAESRLTGTRQINESVNGGMASFPVQIIYDATIEVKDGRYKILINNVHVNDNKSNYVLEDMGRYQKKWLGRTNERIPDIVAELKKKPLDKKW